MITGAITGHMTAAQAESDLVSVKASVNRLLEVDPVRPLAILPHEACQGTLPNPRSGHRLWKNHELGFFLIVINHKLPYTHLTVGKQNNISADLNEHGALQKWDEV